MSSRHPAGFLSGENILPQLVTCCRALAKEPEAREWTRKSRVFLEARVQDRTEALRQTPSDPAMLSARGKLLARLGRFRESADDYERAIRIAPGDHRYWHDGLVPMLLGSGDVERYRIWRHRELQQFAQTSDAGTAHRVAKDALMTALSGEELKVAAELADRAMIFPRYEWASYQTKGMAQYRCGRYAEAIASLIKSKELTPKRSATPNWLATDDLFLAMSHARTGDHQQAREDLARAVQLIDGFPEAGDLREVGSSDWTVCQVVRREAEALINGNALTTKPAASTQPVE